MKGLLCKNDDEGVGDDWGGKRRGGAGWGGVRR